MKPWVIPAVLVMTAAVFLFGNILMPAAELMPAQIQSGSWMPGLSPVRSYEAMQTFAKVGDQLTNTFFKMDLEKALKEPFGGDQGGTSVTKKVEMTGEVRAYVIYAVCLGLAFIFAAIAFNAIGRWDSEEKTVIPVKK